MIDENLVPLMALVNIAAIDLKVMLKVKNDGRFLLMLR